MNTRPAHCVCGASYPLWCCLLLLLRRFIMQGTEFDNFYVAPMCSQSRAALLTGRDFARTGTMLINGGEPAAAQPAMCSGTWSDSMRGMPAAAAAPTPTPSAYTAMWQQQCLMACMDPAAARLRWCQLRLEGGCTSNGPWYDMHTACQLVLTLSAVLAVQGTTTSTVARPPLLNSLPTTATTQRTLANGECTWQPC